MTRPRSPAGRELLDDPRADPTQVAESLRNIVRSNRWFGGRSALRWALGRVLRPVAPGAELSLLDLGTGAGDLPRDLAVVARRHSVALRPVGLELNATAARIAAVAGVPTILGSAIALPVRDRSVDIVTISQLLHHLDEDRAVELLRAATRVARRAVIVADLERSGLACAAFRVGALALRFDPGTRADGITSIARGFSPAELVALCHEAGIHAVVHRRPFFRLVALWPAGAA
ncbi:MAG: methyltransferase domain-containing protein [Gemmatimonadales bacterium]